MKLFRAYLCQASLCLPSSPACSIAVQEEHLQRKAGLGPTWFCTQSQRACASSGLAHHSPREWRLWAAVLCREGWLGAAPEDSHEHPWCFRLFQNGQRVETCCFPRVLLGRWGALAIEETISSCGEPSVNSLWARCPDLLVFSCQKSSPSSQ